MAEEKLIRNPKLIIGETEKVEAEVVGADDIVVITDEEFYTAKEVDDLLKNSGYKFPILAHIFSDHIINNMSWLRADTFSWHSGETYKAAYEHLADDLDIVPYFYVKNGDLNLQYLRYADGDVSGAINPYCWKNISFGYAYTQDESPSINDTIYAFPASSDFFGSIYLIGTCPSMLAQTDTIGDITITYYQAEDGHKICLPDQESNIVALYEATGVAWYYILDTENKQFKLPREDKDGEYLYFYVGNFEQTAIEQTAGLNAELFNGKADVSRVEILEGYDYVVESQQPTADNGYTWYRKYKSGWVEQGGKVVIDNNANSIVTLPVIMANTDYTITLGQKTTNVNTFYSNQAGIITYDTTQITLTNRRFSGSTTYDLQVNWQVSGMSAQ